MQIHCLLLFSLQSLEIFSRGSTLRVEYLGAEIIDGYRSYACIECGDLTYCIVDLFLSSRCTAMLLINHSYSVV